MNNIIYAAVFSFILCLLVGPFSISVLRRLKFGQSVRIDGPQTHLKKSGTPTMGGVIIIVVIILAVIFFVRDFTDALWVLFALVGFGFIGFLDDFIMIISKRSLGLKAREKLLGQIALSLFLAFAVYNSPELGTQVMIPFTDQWIDLGIFYIPFAMFVVVALSNAVNITDGLDGLAAGTVAIASGAFAYISLQSGNTELAVVAAAITGACLGFSWFNSYPAQVIMGDTGALALGSALAALALFLKRELVLPLVGGVFVIETLSVIIQVVSYKLTRKRVFRMSPIHHHFELKGWMETKVVTRFWLIGLLCGIMGILSA
jgi:phospho-N-acetylmuramoyl-pentapeptide-transferase